MDQIRDKSGKFSKANNSKTQSKRGDNFSKFNKRAKTTFEDHSYFRSESETESRDGDLDFEGGGNEIDIGCNVDLPLFGDDNDDFWRCGRRVVELELLAKNLYCCICNSPLHLSDIVRERRFGLGMYLSPRFSHATPSGSLFIRRISPFELTQDYRDLEMFLFTGASLSFSVFYSSSSCWQEDI